MFDFPEFSFTAYFRIFVIPWLQRPLFRQGSFI